jgi:hypothetical protein
MKDSINTFNLINGTTRVTRLAVRDLASFNGFEEVKKLVEQDRVLRGIRRHHKKISETLGEQYLKKKGLNKSAYVCINDDFHIAGYIEGLSELPSPPISATSSAKPSVVKPKRKAP